MALYRRPGSPYWWCKFNIQKQRIQKSTEKTDKREAFTREKEIKREERTRIERDSTAAPIGPSNANGPLTVGLVWDYIWAESISNRADCKDIKTDYLRMINYTAADATQPFARDRRLHDITNDEVRQFRDWRRKHYRWDDPDMGPISDRTVNVSSTELVRRLFTSAKRDFQASFDPNKAPKFKKLLLKLHKERPRVVDQTEFDAMFDELGKDYAAVVEFGLVSGLRMDNCMPKWTDFPGLKKIMIKGKGGKTYERSLSEYEIKILKARQGHHPTWVFTFSAQRTYNDARSGIRYIKGRRYPITYDGLKSAWRRARGRAVLNAPSLLPEGDRRHNLRFHDLRHTFANKLKRMGVDVRTIQKMLNHSRLETTENYLHSFDDELLTAATNVQAALAEQFKLKG